METASETVAYE